jgi:hypothetical protein
MVMADFRKFETMIEETIDLNEVKYHLYLVKSSFDPELEGLLAIKIRNLLVLFISCIISV